ncbi:MAG: DUF2207 domain-containing protein [Candidatus Levyibacteriota bacterium]
MKKIILLITFLFFFIKPSIIFAEIIHSFDVDIKAEKNGQMEIVEIINYDFENLDRHGIYRFISLYTKVGDWYRIIDIKNVKVERDGQSENFKKTQTSSQAEFKIGDANKTITGSHIYKIYYTVTNGIGSNFPEHDEIYWNTTGNKWEVVIEKASVKITTDFDAKKENVTCFTGSFSSKEKNCETQENITSSLNALNPGEGLTVVAVYPVNTFPKSVLSKNPPQDLGDKIFNFILKNYYLVLIFLNLIFAPYLFLWYQKNKNKKRFGKPGVNFDTPKDDKGRRIIPALSGIIDTTKLERDDIVGTIFDLAIRKYIKLEEVKESSKVFGIIDTSHKEQIIKKLKKDDSNLSEFEKILLNRLFKDGDSIKVSELKTDFYKTFSKLEKEAFKTLVEKKYYIKNPKTQKALLIMAALFSFFTLNLFLSGTLFFLSKKLKGRTFLGDEMDFRVDGLKLFLKSMDRNYKWQAERFYIVERMIPYAMALGYIDKFMEQLKLIKPDYNPTWYSGYSGGFYGGYAGFYSSMTTSMTTSSSSGASGGFSGGGGGGGGGGSW